MLIGEDDISNDLITLGTFFFFNVCLHMHSFPLHTDWQKSDSSVDGYPQANWRWNSNSRDVVASCLSFSLPTARASQRACSETSLWWTLRVCSFKMIQIRIVCHLDHGTSIELINPLPVLYQVVFIGSSYALWFEVSQITDLDLDHPNRMQLKTVPGTNLSREKERET